MNAINMALLMRCFTLILFVLSLLKLSMLEQILICTSHMPIAHLSQLVGSCYTEQHRSTHRDVLAL